jgi:hypothetical protein
VVTAGSAHVYDRDAERFGKETMLKFGINPEAPKSWDYLRIMAQRDVNHPELWPKSTNGFKHRVPQIFVESAF